MKLLSKKKDKPSRRVAVFSHSKVQLAILMMTCLPAKIVQARQMRKRAAENLPLR